VTRVARIDSRNLKAMLALAIQGVSHLGASAFLLAIGACYLSAEPECPAEQGIWASLFELQATIENVNGAEVLAALAGVEVAS
jgi:hypothetical protein